jgi:hypothetical protein
MVRADLDGTRCDDDSGAVLAAVTIVVPGTARAELASERCGGEAGAVRGGGVDGTVLAATISVKRPQVG